MARPLYTERQQTVIQTAFDQYSEFLINNGSRRPPVIRSRPWQHISQTNEETMFLHRLAGDFDHILHHAPTVGDDHGFYPFDLAGRIARIATVHGCNVGVVGNFLSRIPYTYAGSVRDFNRNFGRGARIRTDD